MSKVNLQIENYFERLLNRKPHNFPKKGESLKNITSKHGVYIIYSSNYKKILHIGRTYRGKNGLEQRITNHLHKSSSFMKYMIEKKKFTPDKLRKCKFRYIIIGNDKKRAYLESLATGKLCPLYIGTHAKKEEI